MLFKSKLKTEDSVLISLFKYFSITPPKGNGLIDYLELKKPDFLFLVNKKLM